MNFGNSISEPLIFLVRHGAIETFTEKRFIGQIDLPLSSMGRIQAAQLEKSFRDTAFSQAFCSDLKRAAQTADIICGNRNITAQPAPALREIHLGDWDGQPMAHIKERYPDLWQARGMDMGGFRPPGGESFADLRHRAAAFIRQMAQGMTGNSLVVTHAGVIRVLLCHILQMPLSHLFRIHLDYGGWTVLQNKNGQCRVMAVNITQEELPGTDDLPSMSGAVIIEA